MGPSCRSDSVYFLVFSSGDCSNPVRISWGCCLLVAICILQHYLPWHLDGPEKVRVLFPSEPLIQGDLEHVLHHLCHHWSQHSDQRNQTSAHQMEQKMPSIKTIHCTNTRLCLICLWAQTSGRCLQVFPLYVPSHWQPHLSLWWFLGCTRNCLLQAAEMILWVSWRCSVCCQPYPRGTLQPPFTDCEPLAKAALPVCLCKTSCAEALPQLWPQKHSYKTSYK